MEIRPGNYKTQDQTFAKVEIRQEYPVPGWRGWIGEHSRYPVFWTDEGKESTGHTQWDLVKTSVRWNLQCIPADLDQFVRHRQIEEGKKYLCQQVVADLQDYYRILERQVRTGDIIREG